MKAFLTFILMTLASYAAAAIIHVAPTGADTNSGAQLLPVATVNRAVALALAPPAPHEVIIHAGTYNQHADISAPAGDSPDKCPPLLIRAADGEEVVFDGGRLLADAQPVPGMERVYSIKGKFTFGNRPPALWEEDTRTRYIGCADARSVAAFPGSFAVIGDQEIQLQTSDSKPPQEHRVFLGFHENAFYVTRPNVTLRGMTFKGYNTWRWSAGAVMAGVSGVVESCTAINCYRGFMTGKDSVNVRLSRCKARDIGGGIYLSGKNATVEHCHLTKTRDRFMIPVYDQDDTGIQFYSPACGGIVRFNFCQGFNQGIFAKAAPAAYIFEHNTLVDGIKDGLFNNQWTAESCYRQNIISGFVYPLLGPEGMAPGAVFDENIFWNPRQLEQNWQCLTVPPNFGTGRRNLMADPQFVAPERGDFRVLPESIGVLLGDKDGPLGAFPAVAADFKDPAPPGLRVEPKEPALPNGPAGKLFFERDPWIGGGRSFVKDLQPDEKAVAYVTPKAEVALLLVARHPTSAITAMKVSLGKEEAKETAFNPYVTVTLADTTAEQIVTIQVKDEAGQWSEPARIPVLFARKAPSLVGEPVVYANSHGAVIAFVTDQPALARLEFSRDDSTWETIDPNPLVKRIWNIGTGGDEVEEWLVPRRRHTIPVIEPAVKANTDYKYRLVLRDIVANEERSKTFTFKTTGASRILHVANSGEDAEERGALNTPLKTAQFAAERALPGDTILLAPGVYGGSVAFYHGGVKDAPITIQAEKPDTVILDGQWKEPVMIRMEHAPHIVVRNFFIRWFGHDGIYISKSPDVTVENCRVRNENFGSVWPMGKGIFTRWSPRTTVKYCALSRLEHAIYLLESPDSTIMYNTCGSTMFSGVALTFSGKGTRVLNNSLCFNGNDSLILETASPSEIEKLESDYNNFAAPLRAHSEDKNETIKPKQAYLNSGSKAVFNVNGKRLQSLKEWQELSKKDAHSIFADPKYIEPAQDDWHVEKDSPNLGAGENRSTIGAFGVKPELSQSP